MKPVPTDVEIKFKGGNMITETDLSGRITYCNRLFIEMSGYDKNEIIGQPQSIVRHPDMPKIAFKEMWNVIKKGDEWEGYVKNMRKDGAFFWAVMYITAKFNDKGEIIGFIALRKKPGLLTLEEMKVKYKDLILIEEISKKYKLN